jgi:hypothetical protein
VNPGGEPERDDTGLPPVDIEIPDDARELDRDVQAYHREIRAQRRQQRGLRLRGSFARDGIVLPLLACCLILALITGTLLTVFTATSDEPLGGLPAAGKQTARPPAASRAASAGAASAGAASAGAASAGASSAAAPGSSAPAAAPTPPPAVVPGLLPTATIAVGGQPVSVRALSNAALLLIPSHCNCAATVGWLIHVVAGAHAQPYLVYTASTKDDVTRLYASLSIANQGVTVLAAEPDNDNLLRESIPTSLPETNLAAILIGPKKNVLYAYNLSTRDNPTTLIRALTH